VRLFAARDEILLERVLERVLPALIAVAADPVLVVDDSGHLVLANHHAYRVFRWDAGTLEGAHIEQLIPERFHARHRGYREAFMRDPHTRATRAMGAGRDLFALRADGSEFPVEVGLTPIGPNGQPGRLVMAYVREKSS
jgi:PAS domain S-box-containing protein